MEATEEPGFNIRRPTPAPTNTEEDAAASEPTHRVAAALRRRAAVLCGIRFDALTPALLRETAALTARMSAAVIAEYGGAEQARRQRSLPMDLRTIYIPNCLGIVILLMLFYASRTKTSRRHTEDKIHTFMVFGVMLGCIMEMLSYTIDGKAFAGARLLNYAANTYLYMVNLLLPFSLLVYVDLSLYGDKSRIWKRYKPQIIVGGVMIAVNIVNFFVPISYYITRENVYERRPISYLYYVVILYYCVSAMILKRRYEKENGAKAFFSIQMFLTPILLGAGLQFLVYGLSLAWLSAALGLLGLFMMQQNEMAYVDSLTDAYNRLYLNHTLSAWISRGNPFSGVMVDVDGFKGINDSYGHSEGDRALKSVAEALKTARVNNELVFRFAGDEFIVLRMSGDEDGLNAYMSVVNRMLEKPGENRPCPISLSYGVGVFENDSADAFMKEIDGRMYRMKEKHHETKPDALSARNPLE